MPRLTVRLSAEDDTIARAYAADRGVPLAIIARSALMGEVRRYVGRNHLLETAIAELKVWIRDNAAELVRIGLGAQGRGNGHKDGPEGLPASADGQKPEPAA